MGQIIKSILGMALILVGAYSVYLWWPDVLTLIRGGSGIVLILFGLIFFALLD